MMNSVMIAAQPEYRAPATKYGGNEVVCQPGCCDTAKSVATIECTETARGINRQARVRYVTLKLAHCQSVPFQPTDITRLNKRRNPWALSRQMARSGIIPKYKK